MKGYFSQLAKHSGIRFPARGEKTSRADRAAKTSEISPLHAEETKMIAPDSSRAESLKTVEQTFSKTDSGETDKKSASTQPPSTRMQSTGELTEAEKTNPHEIDSGRQDFEIPPENSSEIQPVETEISPAAKHTGSAEPQVVEQVIFAEPEKTAEAATENSESPSSQTSAPEFQAASSEKIENRAEQKEYFKKTSELLETGAAGKPEIQQILLREALEWAADAPVSGEAENKTDAIEEQKVKLVESPPLEREPFTLRGEETESHEPAEQNFELSIGTISIVTEAPEKPAQIADLPAEKKTHNTRREQTRRFSRLSRHYL